MKRVHTKCAFMHALQLHIHMGLGILVIREYDSTLYVGMVQGVSNTQYIGIGTKSRKASKTAKARLRRAKYEIFIH